MKLAVLPIDDRLPGAGTARGMRHFVRDMARRPDLFDILSTGMRIDALPRQAILAIGVQSLEWALRAVPRIGAHPGIGGFLREGGHLLLAGVSEGKAFSVMAARRLQRAMAAAGLAADRVLLLQQSESLAAERDAWVAEDRRRSAPRIGVWHHHMHETAHRFAATWADPVQRSERLAAMRQGPPPSRFACLVYKLRPHRSAMLGRIARRGWSRHGLVSCLGEGAAVDITLRVRPQDPGDAFGARFRQDLDAFEALMPRLPLRIDGDAVVNPVFDDHWAIYRSAGLALVAETEMHERLRRFTEKTLKPLLAGRPVLVAGNAGTLSHLQALGFVTFSSILDESYDRIADPDDRLDAVLGEAERLITMPEAAWSRAWRQAAEIGEANMEWAGTGLVPRLNLAFERFASAMRDWTAGGPAPGLSAGTGPGGARGASAMGGERPHSDDANGWASHAAPDKDICHDQGS